MPFHRRRALLLSVPLLFLTTLFFFAAALNQVTAQVVEQDPSISPETPSRMSFQPPKEANSFDDLLPPRATRVDRETQVAFPELSPASTEIIDAAYDEGTKDAATSRVSVPQGLDSGISFNQDLVGVVVEGDAFSRPVDLAIALLAVGENKPISLTLSQDSHRLPDIVYDEGQTALTFELEMEDAAGGDRLSSFDKQVRLAIDLRRLGLTIPEGMSFFLAYQDEENPQEWI